MMAGAKNFVSSENSLQFDLSRSSTTNKATRCIITLDYGKDLYSMAFYQWSARKMEMKFLSQDDDLYAEDLQALFTDRTGLYTSL
jgi:hypothetical protein